MTTTETDSATEVLTAILAELQSQGEKLDRILSVFDGIEAMAASNGAMKALRNVKL